MEQGVARLASAAMFAAAWFYRQTISVIVLGNVYATKATGAFLSRQQVLHV
jgi:hypothetical protein